jgi:hypothetical protein
MSTTFNLTNSATEVNTALQAVVGADTTPTDESVNMVTSDGVFTYVNTQLGDLAGKTLTTQGTGILNTNNDTSVPTSAAVISHLESFRTIAVAESTGEITNSSETNYVDIPLSMPNSSSFMTISDGDTINISSGTYLFWYSFEHSTTHTYGMLDFYPELTSGSILNTSFKTNQILTGSTSYQLTGSGALPYRRLQPVNGDVEVTAGFSIKFKFKDNTYSNAYLNKIRNLVFVAQKLN